MKKNLLVYLLLCFFISYQGHAQSPTKSIAVSGRHNIYPAGEKGLILLDRNLKQMASGDLAIGFTGYSTELDKKWTNLYPFGKGMSLAYHEVNEKGIYLLFTNNQRKEYELIVADTEFGHYERSRYTFSEPLLVNELEANYDHIWVSGIVGEHPVIFKLDQIKNTYQTVPVGIPGIIKYVGSLSYNAPTKSLDYLIVGNIDKKDVIIWRSIDENGKVIVNERLPVVRNTIKGIKATRISEDEIFVAGQYSIGQRPRNEGLFTAILGPQSRIDFKPLKEIKALSTYKRQQEVDKKGYTSAKSVKFNKPNRNIFIDEIRTNDAGEIEMSLEVYTDNFKARGTLEKQVIARDRTAQLDLNTYGRRSALSGNDQAETREDLMNRGSATDQLQYQYMDQSLSKAVADGMMYSHTGFQRYSVSMKLLDESGLSFSVRDFGNLNQQTNYKEGQLRYFSKGKMMSFNPSGKTFEEVAISEDEDIQLMPWYKNVVLGVSFESNANKGFVLYRFSAD